MTLCKLSQVLPVWGNSERWETLLLQAPLCPRQVPTLASFRCDERPLFRDPGFRKEFSGETIRGLSQSPPSVNLGRSSHSSECHGAIGPAVSILVVGVTLFQVPWDFPFGRIP